MIAPCSVIFVIAGLMTVCQQQNSQLQIAAWMANLHINEERVANLI
jgi:hypothetical protein